MPAIHWILELFIYQWEKRRRTPQMDFLPISAAEVLKTEFIMRVTNLRGVNSKQQLVDIEIVDTFSIFSVAFDQTLITTHSSMATAFNTSISQWKDEVKEKPRFGETRKTRQLSFRPTFHYFFPLHDSGLLRVAICRDYLNSIKKWTMCLLFSGSYADFFFEK